jgi:dihydropteroate synthase
MAGVKIMGILNVTPDSFSDGGRYSGYEAMHCQVQQMIADGATIIDVGGESTRPFATPVSLDLELERVIPAIEMIRKIDKTIPVSIDTTKAGVAQKALAAGATMVNDISALRQDEDMAEVVCSYKEPVIIMHMQGTPDTMQIKPRYASVVDEICAFFEERLAWMAGNEIEESRVILDPGIGFGKTLEHNLDILRSIATFKQFGCPVLIGHSRKSFFETLLKIPLKERDCPTAIVSALCVQQGADILRVHDVLATQRAVRLAEVLQI